MVAFSKSVVTVKVSAVVTGAETAGVMGEALACSEADGIGAALPAGVVATASAVGFGWLYFCQFSQSMKLEKVKIMTSIRRRVSMNNLQKNS